MLGNRKGKNSLNNLFLIRVPHRPSAPACTSFTLAHYMVEYVLPLLLSMCNLMEEVLKKDEILNASSNTQAAKFFPLAKEMLQKQLPPY